MFAEAHCPTLLQVPEYADFSDLSERVYFPGDLDMGQFKNHTLHPVIWSDSGETQTLRVRVYIMYTESHILG
jgi:hypothetical protein